MDITGYWIRELSPIPQATINIKNMEYIDRLIKIEGTVVCGTARVTMTKGLSGVRQLALSVGL